METIVKNICQLLKAENPGLDVDENFVKQRLVEFLDSFKNKSEVTASATHYNASADLLCLAHHHINNGNKRRGLCYALNALTDDSMECLASALAMLNNRHEQEILASVNAPDEVDYDPELDEDTDSTIDDVIEDDDFEYQADTDLADDYSDEDLDDLDESDYMPDHTLNNEDLETTDDNLYEETASAVSQDIINQNKAFLYKK